MDTYSSFTHNCQTWKQPRYPSVGEWINKLWYFQTMEYHTALKKKEELSSHEKTWRILKCTLLSKRSQSEKTAYCIIPTLWCSGKGKTMETIKSSVVTKGWGGVWGEDKYAEHRWFLGHLKYSVWYYDDRYIPLYICPHLQNVKHQTWTLR